SCSKIVNRHHISSLDWYEFWVLGHVIEVPEVGVLRMRMRVGLVLVIPYRSPLDHAAEPQQLRGKAHQWSVDNIERLTDIPRESNVGVHYRRPWTSRYRRARPRLWGLRGRRNSEVI